MTTPVKLEGFKTEKRGNAPRPNRSRQSSRILDVAPPIFTRQKTENGRNKKNRSFRHVGHGQGDGCASVSWESQFAGWGRECQGIHDNSWQLEGFKNKKAERRSPAYQSRQSSRILDVAPPIFTRQKTENGRNKKHRSFRHVGHGQGDGCASGNWESQFALAAGKSQGGHKAPLS